MKPANFCAAELDAAVRRTPNDELAVGQVQRLAEGAAAVGAEAHPPRGKGVTGPDSVLGVRELDLLARPGEGVICIDLIGRRGRGQRGEKRTCENAHSQHEMRRVRHVSTTSEGI